MHAEPASGPTHPESPPASVPPRAGEWAIGIGFILAALLFVAWVAWSIATL